MNALNDWRQQRDEAMLERAADHMDRQRDDDDLHGHHVEHHPDPEALAAALRAHRTADLDAALAHVPIEADQ